MRGDAGECHIGLGRVARALWTGAALWALAAAGHAAHLSNEPIKPLPSAPALDGRKVELGARLFNSPLLSANGRVSCASCHLLAVGGADSRSVSIGANGVATAFNAPSVLNAAYNFRQFWDGRAATLEEQITGVVTGRDFDTTWPALLARINAAPELAGAIRDVYAEAPSQKNIADAIATFERSLPQPSRFDRYLRGDERAVDEDEKRGYQKFKSYGCVACHQGVNIGGNMFQTFGVMGNYFKERNQPVQESDLGRYNITRRDADRHKFKVPSLRNVALTAPYFHDGSVARLEDAVDIMFKYQLGRTAPAADKALIVKFLHSLSGERAQAVGAGKP